MTDKRDCLETVLMVKICNIIPEWFNSTQKATQRVEVDLKKVLDLIYSLDKFLKSLQDRQPNRLTTTNKCHQLEQLAEMQALNFKSWKELLVSVRSTIIPAWKSPFQSFLLQTALLLFSRLVVSDSS